MVFSSLRHSKLRSFLTLLGIVIGVMTVVALLLLMNCLTREMTSEFKTLGAGTLTVQVIGTRSKSRLSEEDLNKLKELRGIRSVSPALRQTARVAWNGKVQKDVTVSGVSYAAFQLQSYAVRSGRPLLPVDEAERLHVCVIDQALCTRLLGHASPIGQQIYISSVAFQVVGVLDDAQSTVMSEAAGDSGNGLVVMPYLLAQKHLKDAGMQTVECYLAEGADIDEATTRVRVFLDDLFQHQENAYLCIAMESLLSTIYSVMDTMTGIFVGIASIALLVGGIGIMNIMLVSVSERTREIGLYLAVGARVRVIRTEFLLESVVLSLLGGLTGVGLGMLVSAALCMLLNVGFIVSWGAIALGLGFSVAVGVTFGWGPARKASKLKPIDALRTT